MDERVGAGGVQLLYGAYAPENTDRAAGLDCHPSSGLGLRERFNRAQCVEAVRRVGERLDHCPLPSEYERYARESAGELSSGATVAVRCGGCGHAVRLAGVAPVCETAGPVEN